MKIHSAGSWAVGGSRRGLAPRGAPAPAPARRRRRAPDRPIVRCRRLPPPSGRRRWGAPGRLPPPAGRSLLQLEFLVRGLNRWAARRVCRLRRAAAARTLLSSGLLSGTPQVCRRPSAGRLRSGAAAPSRLALGPPAGRGAAAATRGRRQQPGRCVAGTALCVPVRSSVRGVCDCVVLQLY